MSAFSALVMPGIRGLRPYEPGKPIEELAREYGVTDAVKLASNENPLGPSPLAVEAMRSHLASVALYPDGAGYALRHKLAQRHGVGPEQITLGNGSNDVLDLVARVFAGPGREVVFSQYAFAVYPLVALAVSATPVEAPARGFGHDLDAMRARVDERTAVVFIANPNNPTGTWLRADELERFIRNLPDHVLVVVDEAYFEYVQEPDYPDTATWVARHPNLIVTRTFSKVYGLAGLRVGYAVSHPEVADLLNRVRQPFNVNTLAQVAALAALDDMDHVRRAREVNRVGMGQLRGAFERLGLEYIPSVANFLCVDMGGPAIDVYERLLREGVITRPLAGYGLPRHLRVTVGRESENERFIASLGKPLKKSV
jgi:histidinol-phosphate aminotransferase